MAHRRTLVEMWQNKGFIKLKYRLLINKSPKFKHYVKFIIYFLTDNWYVVIKREPIIYCHPKYIYWVPSQIQISTRTTKCSPLRSNSASDALQQPPLKDLLNGSGPCFWKKNIKTLELNLKAPSTTAMQPLPPFKMTLRQTHKALLLRPL